MENYFIYTMAVLTIALRSLLVQLFARFFSFQLHVHSAANFLSPLLVLLQRFSSTLDDYFFSLFSRFLHNNSPSTKENAWSMVYGRSYKRERERERNWKSIFQKRLSNHFFYARFLCSVLFFFSLFAPLAAVRISKALLKTYT